MHRFFKPVDKVQIGGSSSNDSPLSEKRQCVELSDDDDDIIADPGKRKQIGTYPIALQDDIRKRYLLKGPCQPKGHLYPPSIISDTKRYFQEKWFSSYPWLEYSVSKDVAFCFYCYLFAKGNRSGDKAFTEIGFRNWKKGLENLQAHVGGMSSPHHFATERINGFQRERLNVDYMLSKSNDTNGVAYFTRITSIVKVVRLLLKQAMPFCGHDESPSSLDRGNFFELLTFLCNENEEVNKVMFLNAPKNNQMTSPYIQKDVIKACASETLKVILKELGGKSFSLLVDESRDCSVKEQMSLVIRFVNDHGEVLERFVGIVHVKDTSARSLKMAVDNFFAANGLSLSSLRGQGYDGAANMRGEFNGLKTLILAENKHAHYIHCFAHQLQLVVVNVAEVNNMVGDFFSYLSLIVNTAGASCKRRDNLREIQREKILQMLESGEISSGKGKHQETSLARPGDTRWGSHYVTVSRLISMWSSVKEVLTMVEKDATDGKVQRSVWGLLTRMYSYELAFIAHLMKHILGKTNVLSKCLQMKHQNIANATRMIQLTKHELKEFLMNGWDQLLEEVSEFCGANDIEVPNMEDTNTDKARRLLNRGPKTNFQHFNKNIFVEVMARLIREFDSRFSESNTEILMCMSCLDPTNSFENFDHQRVLRLAELYSEDFSYCDLSLLKDELKLFISEMRSNDTFSTMEDLAVLAKKMVELKYHSLFPFTYRLIELILILPVATASVERSFSAMKLIKTDLRNKMCDDFLKDCMLCYVEKKIFVSIETEAIVRNFQAMAQRRNKLPRIM